MLSSRIRSCSLADSQHRPSGIKKPHDYEPGLVISLRAVTIQCPQHQSLGHFFPGRLMTRTLETKLFFFQDFAVLPPIHSRNFVLFARGRADSKVLCPRIRSPASCSQTMHSAKLCHAGGQRRACHSSPWTASYSACPSCEMFRFRTVSRRSNVVPFLWSTSFVSGWDQSNGSVPEK